MQNGNILVFCFRSHVERVSEEPDKSGFFVVPKLPWLGLGIGSSRVMPKPAAVQRIWARVEENSPDKIRSVSYQI